MGKILSQRMIADYEELGAITGIPVLTAAETAEFLAELETVERALGGKLLRIDAPHLFLPWAYRLAIHPRVLDVMEDLLGPELFVHSTRIFYKHGEDPSFVSWHQDGLYSDLNSKPAPTAWVALTESTPENGCVRVIPGSHLNGKLSHTETYGEKNLLNHGELVDIPVDETKALDLVLRPGEMSIHHVNTIHGSNPNASQRRRVGFSMSYITPKARHSNMPVVHARGVSNDHSFEMWDPPVERDLQEALAAHAEFMRKGRMRLPRVAAAS